MYSTAKKMSTISAVCCAANFIGLLLYLLASTSLNIPFALSFAILTFMITTTGILLMLTLGLRGLCQDLDYEFESSTLKLREINKRLNALEHKE